MAKEKKPDTAWTGIDWEKIKRADDEIRRKYEQQAANGKRWCYDCGHYRESYMCGYSQCLCRLHGSLDADQKRRHPDITADTCQDYIPNGKEPWYKRLFG